MAIAEVRGEYRGFRYLETRGNCFSRIYAVLKSKNLLMDFRLHVVLGAPSSALQTQPREFRSHCATTMWAIPSAESFPFPSSGKVTPHAGIYKYPSASRNNKNIDLLG
jgi:hypothetical protein